MLLEPMQSKRRKRAATVRPRATGTRPPPARRDVPAPPEAGPVETSSEPPLCIVGVGASAGGLEAFTQLLASLPPDPGAALVLVQHLDPKHESILASLLSRSTSMPVRETHDGIRLDADHVYVIPPTVDIALADGHIRHVPRGPRQEPHLPIDLFLRTLAEVQGNRAIAVILSGTGTDGTLGCQSVRTRGGIVFAQEPGSAKFDGMPYSAIRSGCVDSVQSPAEIGREIVRLARGQYVRESRPEATDTPSAEDEKDLARIFALLKKVTGADFTCYKRTTLQRRIRRRMAVHRVERLEDYATLLEDQPGEVQDLQQDLLINVTSFFRDPETFRLLAEVVLPRIVRSRGNDAPLRVWVPGCATGEEAYSIAICLLESQSERGASPPIQIFASDLSEAAITTARNGVYPENIAADVSRERLLRFFVKVDGHYQVSKAVRDQVIFARQNLTRDPPFSRMDLVSCRNVLIYLEPPMQKKVMATFHYALQPDGLLLLGQSETVGASSDFFTVVDREHKVYAKRPQVNVPLLSLPPGLSPAFTAALPRPAASLEARPDVEREAQRLLLNRYAPASVLVDERENVFHFRGDTEAYLGHAQGAASFQLVRIVRKELLADLRRLLHAARTSNASQRREGLTFHYQGRTRRVALEVIPLQGPASGDPCLLVLFDEGTRRRPPATPPLPRGASAEKRAIVQLQEELQALRHYQQAMQEEQEGANEELQSANEEIVSSNEELQSINEELETAKEELQSNNEELMTLNEELQARNLELQRLHDDLDNVLASATVPMLLLGRDLMLRRYTPAAGSSLGMVPADIGRPLGRLRMSLPLSELEAQILSVLETMRPSERELQDGEGCWWQLQVRPYLTRDNRIDGTVLVLQDIDTLKRNQRSIEEARDLAEAIVDTARAPLLLLDTELRVRRANTSFRDSFGLSLQEIEGVPLYELGGRQWDTPGLRRLLNEVVTQGHAFDDHVLEGAFGASARTLVVNARRLPQKTFREDLILLAIEDRTEAMRAEADRADLLKRAEEAARLADAANRLKDEFVANASHELRGPLAAMVTWTHLLATGDLDAATMSRGVAAIERSAHSQTRLIEDLLDVTRISLGKLRLETRLTDLRTVVEAALETARPAAEAKGVALSLTEGTMPELVLGDAGRLQQVVWNLMSNAVKFTAKGGHVEVSWGRVGTNVEIKVVDDGQGISPAFLPHVFERFRQADGTTSRPQPGLGLGLSIVRQLVELHGGTATAASPGEGRGSTFVVSLPVPALSEEPAGREVTARRAVETAQTATPPSLHGLRLLVVDDDADGREAVQAVLEMGGAQVTAVASVAEALAAFDKAAPDILVSDIGMPIRDGYDLIREVRKRPPEKGGTVPALALTAYAAVEDRLKTASAGFQAYLAKPAEPSDLVARVSALARR
jgi:two-component system CheB/CheR fusion protein